MKHILTSAFVFGLALTAAPSAFADDHKAGERMEKSADHQPLRAAYLAEHAAWATDHERWEAEHEEAVVILRAVLNQLKNENKLTSHDKMIEAHGKDLVGLDMKALAKEHAMQRVAHEEMRDAHHHLMDAVRALELAAAEDLAAEAQ